MTIHYDPRDSSTCVGLLKLIFRWRGTMLPLVFYRASFWLLLAIHFFFEFDEHILPDILGSGFPDVDWDQFVGGVQERLQLGAISRIETSAGERIMSVADLMHDDHLVIHSDYLMGARGRQLFQQQQPAGQPYEAAAAGEEEAITFDLAPRDEGAFLEEAPTAEGRNGWHLRPERRQATRPGRVGEGRRRRRGRLRPASCCGAGRPRASTCRCT